MPLRPLAEAFAGEPAGADGHARLDGLVAGAFGVLLRIHEAQDPGALVILEGELPGDGRGEQRGEGEHAEEPQAQAGEERRADEHRQQGDRRAEVRLLGDEEERDSGEDAAENEVAGVRRAPPVLAEVHRQQQRDADPGELGGLQVKRPDRDPALAAHLRLPLHEYEDEQRQERSVDEQGVLRQHPVVHRQADQQRDETERERVGLGPHLRRRAAAGRGRDVGGAVDHRDADRRQQDDGAEEEPVDVEVEASLEHRYCPPPPTGPPRARA